MRERVIVVGVTEDNLGFAACVPYRDDDQLASLVNYRFGCQELIIFYDENIDELEDALEDYYVQTSPRVKLTPEDRRCIKGMLETRDFTQKEIAENYGVSAKTVYRISKERI